MEEWELTGQTKEEGNSELTEDEQAKEGVSELEEDFFPVLQVCGIQCSGHILRT